MLSIVNANYKDDFKIVIEFNDHKKGEVDLKDFIFNRHLAKLNSE